MPRICKNNWYTNERIRISEESDQLIVPADKTYIFGCMDTKKYMTTVNEHQRSLSKEIDRYKVRQISEKSRDLVDEFGF